MPPPRASARGGTAVAACVSIGESGPALAIRRIERRLVQREGGRMETPAAFEHERERVFELLRCECCAARLLERVLVGPVWHVAIVQAHPARLEAFALRVVLAVDETHEFAHDVTVVPRRTKRVLGDEPA